MLLLRPLGVSQWLASRSNRVCVPPSIPWRAAPLRPLQGARASSVGREYPATRARPARTRRRCCIASTSHTMEARREDAERRSSTGGDTHCGGCICALPLTTCACPRSLRVCCSVLRAVPSPLVPFFSSEQCRRAARVGLPLLHGQVSVRIVPETQRCGEAGGGTAAAADAAAHGQGQGTAAAETRAGMRRRGRTAAHGTPLFRLSHSLSHEPADPVTPKRPTRPGMPPPVASGGSSLMGTAASSPRGPSRHCWSSAVPPRRLAQPRRTEAQDVSRLVSDGAAGGAGPSVSHTDVPRSARGGARVPHAHVAAQHTAPAAPAAQRVSVRRHAQPRAH